ncbi:hypothetical protein VFPBJ_11188 [Purpureocillium lilacinum]|uniref:Uncharacterized protein n=1 Tax=Purpureocillium lilacinum TaxID=33203 RepID=A0A179FJR2_PURLI|nr:hypothetical protein VFPBJ_11188 [Purpureocillium lilacinum]
MWHGSQSNIQGEQICTRQLTFKHAVWTGQFSTINSHDMSPKVVDPHKVASPGMNQPPCIQC